MYRIFLAIILFFSISFSEIYSGLSLKYGTFTNNQLQTNLGFGYFKFLPEEVGASIELQSSLFDEDIFICLPISIYGKNLFITTLLESKNLKETYILPAFGIYFKSSFLLRQAIVLDFKNESYRGELSIYLGMENGDINIIRWSKKEF